MQSFRIEFDKSLGRHAIATDDILTDQVVLTTTAFSWSISDSFKKKLCGTCLCVALKYFTVKCPCDQMYFCSQSCIQSHDGICMILRKLATLKRPTEDKNIVKLLVMTLYNLSSQRTNAGGYDHPESLQSHYDDWSEEDKKDWNKMKNFLLPLLRESGLECGETEMLCWISKIESNGFGLWGLGKDVCMGRAIFPEASYFNHSCEPNCTSEQDGTKLRIIALKNIPKGKD